MAQSITLEPALRRFAQPALRLSYPSRASIAMPQPAEILVIDPGPGAVVLGVMS